LGWLLNSHFRINGYNGLHSCGLISGTALVGAEPRAVVGVTNFTDVQEIAEKASAV